MRNTPFAGVSVGSTNPLNPDGTNWLLLVVVVVEAVCGSPLSPGDDDDDDDDDDVDHDDVLPFSADLKRLACRSLCRRTRMALLVIFKNMQ